MCFPNSVNMVEQGKYLNIYYLVEEGQHVPYHLVFPVEHDDGGVEQDPQHPNHHQVQGANNEHLSI